MSGKAKAIIAIVVVAIIGALFIALPMFQSNQQESVESVPVEKKAKTLDVKDIEFKSVIKDEPVLRDGATKGVSLSMSADEFEAAGIELGDSLDIIFSNGKTLEDIPYFNGLYSRWKQPLVLAWPGATHPRVCSNYGPAMWDEMGLESGATITVGIHEKGKYKKIQNTLFQVYSDERDHFETDAVFANYREVKGGSLKEKLIFRGASSISDAHSRSSYVNAFMARDGIKYNLDLSDSIEEAAKHRTHALSRGANISKFESLAASGNVGYINLDQGYRTPEYATGLAHGLYEMVQHEGPYYIHCIEGKDRTGFTCMLLEALAGAGRDEMIRDYMTTYTNYFGIVVSNPNQYGMVVMANVEPMLALLADGEPTEDADYIAGAKKYLEYGGLSEEQIRKIVDVISIQS